MHAMIITAYKDYPALRKQVSTLAQRCLCFVHVDAKCEITAEQTAELDAMENVRAIRRYEINWGSIHHLHALLELCRMALEDARVTHLHLISAQDYPVVSYAQFAAFFEQDDRLHMQSLVTADYPELAHRYEHFHFMHIINYRDMSEKTQNLIGRIDRFQEKLRIRRKLSVPRKGLVWCSLPRAAAEYAVNAPRNRRFLRRLETTYIPEEFFFQNAFEGTAFEGKITGNELRFSIWNEPERGLPALLTQHDLEAVDRSGCLFARKIDAKSALFDTLAARWLS